MITTRCSCGFTVETGTAEEGYRITHQHFLDEINTHTISTITNLVHISEPKQNRSWVRRVLDKIRW